MSIILSDNHRTLCNIIYSRDSFTANEVLREYRIARKSEIVDISTNVTTHLNILVEFGAIRKSGNRYIVRSKKTRAKRFIRQYVT